MSRPTLFHEEGRKGINEVGFTKAIIIISQNTYIRLYIAKKGDN